MPSVSIIIRCYNEEQHIGRLLVGIMEQTIKDVEVLLVDSGSTDATLSIASKFPVKVVYISPEDFSFGRSLNMGCLAAQGEFLILISAHAYPVRYDWLERLLDPFRDQKVALVYGKQRGGECTSFSEHQVFAKWFGEESNLTQKSPFCNNANAAIRRTLWERIPYDEDLTGLEDLDWAKRAIDLGYYISYASDAEIIHLHDETPERLFNRYRREAIAFKKVYPHERFTKWDFCKLFVNNILTDYYIALHNGMLSKEFSNIFNFRLMQFWGTYKGFSQNEPISRMVKHTFYYPNGRVQSKKVADIDGKLPCIDYSKLLKEWFPDDS
jgi:glycosyltransferase involved in cell wall biosynthesis